METILEEHIEEHIAEQKIQPLCRPWRRYFARTLDFGIYTWMWQFVSHLIFPRIGVWDSVITSALDVVVGLVLMVALEPLLLSKFGTTMGKVILGLKVTKADGSFLSYGEAKWRTWCVIRYGEGFFIPFYTWYRLFRSYQITACGQLQPWEDGQSYVLKDDRVYRIFVYIMAEIVLLALSFLVVHMEMLPPNQGDLTLEQYAKNYEYVITYYNGGKQYLLDSQGQWTNSKGKDPLSFQVSFEDGEETLPQLHYDMEGDVITGITATLDLKNREEIITELDSRLFALSLAYAGADKNITSRDGFPQRLESAIDKMLLEEKGSLEMETEQFRISGEIESRGYEIGSDIYIPSEDSKTDNELKVTLEIIRK